MKKVNKVNLDAVAAGADDVTSGATTTVAKVLQVKAGQKYRGARQAWYEVLLAHNGKPKAEFLAAVTAQRPSVYGARSKHNGTPEPVAGWYRFYERTGVVSEV